MKIQNGAIIDIPDSRDYQWSEIGKSSTPFDWNKGYDVEEELGFKIPVKSQGNSSSCGGQAFSYYTQVLEALYTKTFEERSAKFLYSQCWLPEGGSRGRDICKILQTQGSSREAFCPSYYTDKTPLSEEDYRDTSCINDIVRQDAKGAIAITYANVNPTIDEVAQAIRDNKGCVIGLTGENNGTWMTEFPKPPTKNQWNHWVYACKAKIIDGKKYIGFINSWGEECGNKGVQWIGEDYFNTVLSYNAVWQVWTFVLKKVDEKRNLLLTLLTALLKLWKKN